MKKLFNRKSSKNKAEKHYVRFSTIEDFDKIQHYYKTHQHSDVRGRDLDLMRKLIAHGDVVLVEKHDGTICASSIMYPLPGKDENGQTVTKWQEMGTVRITLNGYIGLFDAMITAQALRALLVDPPEDRLVAQINPAVYSLANAIGWRPFIPSQELIDSSCQTVNKEEVTEKDQSTEGWFQCGVEGLPHMARALLAVSDAKFLKHKSFKETGKQIEISFERMKLVRKFEDELRILAKKDFGNVDSPAAEAKLKRAQKRWLKNLK